MMPGLSAAVSAMRAAQVGLDVTSNNLANANTDGYHRQRVNLADMLPIYQGGHWVGTGVEVTDIQRLYDQSLENQLNAQRSQLHAAEATQQAAQQLETVVAGPAGNLNQRLAEFFSAATELARQPNDLALRRQWLDAADSVAGEINTLAARLDELTAGSENVLQRLVQQANDLATQVERLTDQIALARARRAEPNDLLDRREQLVGQLSELIDVELGPDEKLYFAGQDRWLVGTERGDRIELVGEQGELFLKIDHSDRTFVPTTGKIGALLSAGNELIAGQRASLEDLATTFTGALNQIHATGLPVGEVGFQQLTSHVSVSNPNVPLAELPGPLALQAGSLLVGVTNVATGQRAVTRITIDPSTQSLNDLATALDGVDRLQALVIGSTGTLQIAAQPGYRFDFTSQVATYPDLSGTTGTAVPKFSGEGADAGTGLLQISVRGTGEVGVTPGLQVDVLDQNATVVSTLDVGLGYPAGQQFQLPNGLRLEFSSGTLIDGETAVLETDSVPDSSGILGALKFQPLFTNTTVGRLEVNRDLLRDPGLLATSGTGTAGNSTPLLAVTALQSTPLDSVGLTFQEYVADWQAEVGMNVQRATRDAESAAAAFSNLQQQHDALSGVDPNEELIRLLEFQRMFQSGAQVVRVLQETTDEILQMIR